MPRPTVRFDDCRVVRGTDDALLIEIEGEETWVPKSIVHADSEIFDDDENSEGTLVLYEWWAEEKGLV